MNKQKAAALLVSLCLLLAPGVPALALDADRLVPVGSAVGIRLDADGVLVVGLADVKTASGTLRPAEAAGLRVGDLVTRVGERKTDSAAAFLTAVSELDGQPVTLTAEREGETVELTVTPAQTVNGAWQLGLWLRDGVSGIGTVTFYDPVSGTFGALGHGVNDLDTGALLPFGEGAITGARVVDVVPGAAGRPGELCGEFDADTEKGVLRRNTTSGIFGVADWQDCGECLPVASEDETELGPASILCCVSGDEVREYSVEISRIYRSPEDHRFLMLTVTDEALLSTTGGIVQGMSGSPIIQNGKLIGAVTHVLINDATRGYGISIRDMLAAA
ncbi:MAG: SpoIVB peptidase [Oscillospiraceae bacterium]|nr:SpoIVB peptidase [Oscillospiraceae bacterium]